MHALISLVFFIILVVAVIMAKIESVATEKERLSRVSAKYSGEVAFRISDKMFWTGQTAEQLRDSLGRPHTIDVKQLKTKSREVWKYDHQGANRYRLRITLDNGQVTTWTKHY